jgi:hypothetical protein
MEMYQIISKYLNTVKKILLDDEIPPTFENLKYYFNEDDVLIEIKNSIGSDNTIRLIYVLVLSDRGISGEKIKDIIGRLKIYNIRKFIDENSRTVTCDECGGYGSEDCDTCDGNGDLECRNCDGNGSTACDDCNGSGEVDDERCSSCQGMGGLECDDCGGSGRETCNNCDGEGNFTCDYCDGSGEYESSEKYFQPEDFYYVKPFSSKDEDYLGKAYEVGQLEDFFKNDELSMFLNKNYDGFSENETDEDRKDYSTDLEEFETLYEIINLNFIGRRLF